MSFDRDRLPHPALYFEAAGLPLIGKGKWRTTRCEFHDGSDSMRVNAESGGWVCMACHVKGGDLISYVMQRFAADFVTAAKTVGAWVEDGRQAPARPRAFSASDAMTVLSEDLHLCAVVLSDVRGGVMPTDDSWQSFLGAARRCVAISEEAGR